MAMKKMAVGVLLQDEKLYPRRKMNDYNIAALAEALRAGAVFPPLVVDTKGRIIDGFHRRAAYEQVFGPEHKVTVEVREYANDAEAFLDAIRLNATHGVKLNRGDEIRCTVHGEELGLTAEAIALALNVTPQRVEKLKVRIVVHELTHESLPSKIVARHLEGQTVTAEQAAALDRGPGLAPLRIINDLRAWLDAGLVDLTDVRVRDALLALSVSIERTVQAEAA